MLFYFVYIDDTPLSGDCISLWGPYATGLYQRNMSIFVCFLNINAISKTTQCTIHYKFTIYG